ncbi:hypothetical protein JZ933_03385 [Riemerella anatipestifer]|uniref:Uncharacterized protein n=1 Tax=Riemerella anatipestifer RA-CH-1 TaxID=1228997 RepID=J9R2X9_RIEAN|nr:hypothetical protein [Riemerella anatipestifer]AFR34733.1 hypothetical protein B739_0125 [Riemerella anatipestifer RA-CH-1]MCW0485800.1 hypothetical protein [Riemerella anatipestifer]MCW0517599.1 hypothetical protein [Riemerella anatipestifer]MDR7764880.1 hypothetical protein [Riemerella anatipestifer]MDR7777660.1 hypothetical protein [Riemerella anatipestifer]
MVGNCHTITVSCIGNPSNYLSKNRGFYMGIAYTNSGKCVNGKCFQDYGKAS